MTENGAIALKPTNPTSNKPPHSLLAEKLEQICNRVQALPQDEKQMFAILRDEAPASPMNQLLLIRDISLQLQTA